MPYSTLYTLEESKKLLDGMIFPPEDGSVKVVQISVNLQCDPLIVV